MSNNQHVCLHITKTAGGTLKRSLQEADGLNVAFVYNPTDREKLTEQDLSDVDLVYGHAIFGVHDEVGLKADTRYMCFMRHPLSRTISHYYHLRNVDQGPVGDKIRLSNDINDFFANHSHWEFANFMTRIISGEGRAQDADEEELLEKAKETLDAHFDFVGFQEFFTFSVRQMSEYLKCALVFEKDINVGRYDLSNVSEETLRLIENANKQDWQLYKYALQRYL